MEPSPIKLTDVEAMCSTNNVCMYCHKEEINATMIWPCLCGKSHVDCANHMLSSYKPPPEYCFQCGKNYKLRYLSEVLCKKLSCDKSFVKVIFFLILSSVLIAIAFTSLYYNIKEVVLSKKLAYFITFLFSSFIGLSLFFSALCILKTTFFYEREYAEIEGLNSLERCANKLPKITEENSEIIDTKPLYYTPQLVKPPKPAQFVTHFNHKKLNTQDS